MADGSKIEWTDATWGPTVGCSYVSEECLNCYAARESASRLRHLPTYAGLATKEPGRPAEFTGEVRMLSSRLDQPLRWRRPRRIFVDSMSDLFHPEVDDLFLAQVFDVMGAASHHQFQVLTKRPKAMAGVLEDVEGEFRYKISLARRRRMAGEDTTIPAWPLPNVWMGTSIGLNKYAWRANYVRRTPAAVRFLSLEPLLGPLPDLDLTDIDWVIVGGESGPGARPMHPDWARDLRDRCVDAGIPFLFKQWGEWVPARNGDEPGQRYEFPGMTAGGLFYAPSAIMRKAGKKLAGRVLDGRTWDGYPVAA